MTDGPRIPIYYSIIAELFLHKVIRLGVSHSGIRKMIEWILVLVTSILFIHSSSIKAALQNWNNTNSSSIINMSCCPTTEKILNQNESYQQSHMNAKGEYLLENTYMWTQMLNWVNFADTGMADEKIWRAAERWDKCFQI